MAPSNYQAAHRRAPLAPAEMPPRDKIGELFALPEPTAHYLRDVLRLEAGEIIDFFDGSGRVIQAQLGPVDHEPFSARILVDRVITRGESPATITLVQALPKGKKFDLVLEKSTELGVSQILPIETSRTVVQINPAKTDAKLKRWQRIISEAARQSGRTVTPQILAPTSLKGALELLDNATFLVAHTAPELPSIAQVLSSLDIPDHHAERTNAPDELAFWVGPEGGFNPEEIALLSARGAHLCGMGPRILRTETAGLVGLTLLQAYRGDLG